MAPEVLNGEILKDYVDNHFKSVLLTDVYSMCLIFWEVIQNIEDLVPMKVRRPYEEFTMKRRISTILMQEIVEHRRPTFKYFSNRQPKAKVVF